MCAVSDHACLCTSDGQNLASDSLASVSGTYSEDWSEMCGICILPIEIFVLLSFRVPPRRDVYDALTLHYHDYEKHVSYDGSNQEYFGNGERNPCISVQVRRSSYRLSFFAIGGFRTGRGTTVATLTPPFHQWTLSRLYYLLRISRHILCRLPHQGRLCEPRVYIGSSTIAVYGKDGLQ